MTNLTNMLSKFVNSNTASTLGSGTLPSNTITNRRMEECLALADLGASINLMPLSCGKKLSLWLTPTCMTLELADPPQQRSTATDNVSLSIHWSRRSIIRSALDIGLDTGRDADGAHETIGNSSDNGSFGVIIFDEDWLFLYDVVVDFHSMNVFKLLDLQLAVVVFPHALSRNLFSEQQICIMKELSSFFNCELLSFLPLKLFSKYSDQSLEEVLKWRSDLVEVGLVLSISSTSFNSTPFSFSLETALALLMLMRSVAIGFSSTNIQKRWYFHNLSLQYLLLVSDPLKISQSINLISYFPFVLQYYFEIDILEGIASSSLNGLIIGLNDIQDSNQSGLGFESGIIGVGEGCGDGLGEGLGEVRLLSIVPPLGLSKK
ncbi:hypothetical protein Tco_0536538 [Tanacetum coccineum]